MKDSIKNILLIIYKPFWRLYKRITLEYKFSHLINMLQYSKHWKQLKNTHVGEKCYVIGNGPSLTSSDLELLKDQYTFASNRVFYIFEKTSWRPTFYCAQDRDVIADDVKNNIEMLTKNCKYLFLIDDAKKYLKSNLRGKNNILFFCAKYAVAHKKRYFYENIDKYISGGSTVTYAAIQIAVYMGFKEIYLLGVDHNYASTSYKDNHMDAEDVRGSYFEGMPTNVVMNRPNTDGATRSYWRAKQYADEHGIIIKNATRGGKLELFGRIKLEDSLK